MGLVEFIDPITGKMLAYNLPELLKPNWSNLSKTVIKENDDRVYIVVGQEGCGKSTWAFQTAKYIDPTFDINRICFTADQFLEQITSAPKGSVVIFDEAFRGFSSKSSQSKVNKVLVQAMMEVRRRNLIIFIIIPSFILLEHYIAVHRSNALFVIYRRKDKGRKTWHWKAYNRNKTAEIYEKSKKKFGRIPNIYTNMRGKFWARLVQVGRQKRHLPYETFDEKAYDHKKGVAFGDKHDKEEIDKFKIAYDELRLTIAKVSKQSFPIKDKKRLAEALEISHHTVRGWKNLENQKKED